MFLFTLEFRLCAETNGFNSFFRQCAIAEYEQTCIEGPVSAIGTASVRVVGYP